MENQKQLLEVVSKLRTLADSLEGLCGTVQPQVKTKQKPVTLEEVRAILAQKSQEGKTAKVKELITKYGATKLSDVKEKDFSSLLQDAEEL